MPCTKILCPEPVSIITPVPEPSVTAASTSHVPNIRLSSAKKAFRPELGRPFTSLTYLNDDFIECIASIPSCPQVPRAPSR